MPPINLDVECPSLPAPEAKTMKEGIILSPSAAAVKSIFPTSKSRSLKKKNSILAKRRCVPAKTLAALGGGAAACGRVWQRVRARGAPQPRWAPRYLLLAHLALYAYRTPECTKADCMIYLSGFTVAAAGEVKSRAHAFKVYHTGTAFYFACHSREQLLAWLQLLQRATDTDADADTGGRRLAEPDISKQFSETDYSETESDNESSEKRSERERERERERAEKREEKDKSKFGSLKKLTGRMQRSESHENVAHASTSLDRKYLRFFYRNKSKDDSKAAKSTSSKQPGVAVPTEQYRSYRRAAAPPAHASNPDLAEPWPPRPAPARRPAHNLPGLLTLEEFMLQKQEEERRQVYTDRVLLGIERSRLESARRAAPAPAPSLQRRLQRIVPDVIYGELPAAPAPAPAPGPLQGRSLPRTPSDGERAVETTKQTSRESKPISVKGKDGYEKLVYPPEAGGDADKDDAAHHHERWRDSLRRNDKVHTAAWKGTAHSPQPAADSWVGAGGNSANSAETSTSGVASRPRLVFGAARENIQPPPPPPPPPPAARRGAGGQYPHLQCPPTFQPETYSLARLAPPPPPPRDP